MGYFEYGADFDVEDFLEQSQRQERQRLEADLDRIDQQLEERDQVHDEIVDELESKLDWYTDRLETLYREPGGDDDERDRLKSRIISFYADLREEKRDRWQDKQRLEKERRDLERELRELDDQSLAELIQ